MNTKHFMHVYSMRKDECEELRWMLRTINVPVKLRALSCWSMTVDPETALPCNVCAEYMLLCMFVADAMQKCWMWPVDLAAIAQILQPISMSHHAVA